MPANIKWAFLCSSWGKNAKDVISYYAITNQVSKIGLVIYETENSGAAIEASKNGINTLLIKPKSFKNKHQYQKEILRNLLQYNISNIFLLGYKYLVLKPILDTFPNKIINVHPSLFPSFLGTKTAIQDALDYGVKVTGITCHVIDHEFDKGIIIAQEPIRIDEEDTFETLYPKFSEVGLDLILRTITIIEKS